MQVASVEEKCADSINREELNELTEKKKNATK